MWNLHTLYIHIQILSQCSNTGGDCVKSETDNICYTSLMPLCAHETSHGASADRLGPCILTSRCHMHTQCTEGLTYSLLVAIIWCWYDAYMVHNVLANPNIEQPFYTNIAELLRKANNRNVQSLAFVCIYAYPSHLHVQEDPMFLYLYPSSWCNMSRCICRLCAPSCTIVKQCLGQNMPQGTIARPLRMPS